MAVPLRTKKLPSQSRENRQSVGVASIPQQVMQKLRAKGFDFCIMVAGESGLGKSTLISTLFGPDKLLPRTQQSKTAAERIEKTVGIEAIRFSIEEKGITARMTVLDTPGFADSVDTRGCWEPIVRHIDGAYQEFLEGEMRIQRSGLPDNRVHALLYFINPSSHGLKPLDVEALLALHYKVNIIPVIAKADTLTKPELKKLKDAIRADLQKHDIRVFVPATDDESSPLYDESVELETLMPFAVVGASKTIEVGGRQLRGRVYPWGVVEVDNSEHCDFVPLRKMLIITHTQELKDLTSESLYENWRRETLARNPGLLDRVRADDESETRERERKLAEANEEIARKQEQMKRELEEQRLALERAKQQFEEERRQLLAMQQAARQHDTAPSSSAV